MITVLDALPPDARAHAKGRAHRAGFCAWVSRAVVAFCAGLVAHAVAANADGSGTPDPAAPAMARFVDALEARDLSAFAALFPREGSWTYLSTLTESGPRISQSGESVKRDLHTREGLYHVFFSDADLDTFRDWVMMTGGRDWVRTGSHRFSPPGLGSLAQKVFVGWRREDGRWVVDVVAEPAA